METISKLVTAIRLGDPRRHRGLTMVPLFVPAPQDGPGFMTLDAALATGRFRIAEVSEAGTVPRLRASNATGQPVFLLDGEELVGAKQNRVLNLSLILPESWDGEIPVSCVEAGRWRRETSEFSGSGRAQFAEGRARKLRSVTASLEHRLDPLSDQGEVWDLIARKAARMRAESATAAMAEIFEKRSSELDEYIGALAPAADECGALFLIGGRPAGMDLFDHPAPFSALGRKLIASYALDAIEHEQVEGTLDPPATANAFLTAMVNAGSTPFDVAGGGTTVRLHSRILAGAALEWNGRCIHLAAFPAQHWNSTTPRRRRFVL